MKRIIKTNILNPIDRVTTDFQKNVFITIEDTKIVAIESNDTPNFEFEDLFSVFLILLGGECVVYIHEGLQVEPYKHTDFTDLTVEPT